MDMSGMDMSGGMDSSSDPMFRPFNQSLAEDYWYIFVGILGFIVLVRAVDYYQTWSRSVIPIVIYLCTFQRERGFLECTYLTTT